MKDNQGKIKHESDRIAIVLGIIATYIALFSIKDTLPFNKDVIISAGGYSILYLAGYLVMTAFCYRYDDSYVSSIMRIFNRLRQHYYDVGVLVMPLVFSFVLIWSVFENTIARTIGAIVVALAFLVVSFLELRHKVEDSTRSNGNKQSK